MKTFDANYRLLEEMYQDEYYPDFLVDKVKTELQKVIALLEEGETDTKSVQEKLDESVCVINALQEEFEEHDSEIETVARRLHWRNGNIYSGLVRYSHRHRGSDSGKGLVKQSQPQKHNQLHNSNHFSPMIWAKNSSTVLNSIFRRTESWDYSANY